MHNPISGHDVVQLVHRLLAVVLQVCVPPLDLGIHAAMRMSDANCVDHAGANAVARESDLRILWVDTLQVELCKRMPV